MKNHKKFLCFAFPVAVVMALVLGLAFMNIGAGKELANAASSIYVESGGTCTISGGTISDDIDVAGGTLTLTGGSVGNINLNGTLNLSSGATINGTVNLQNTNSYITLTSSLTKTISVKASSTAAGTRIAYSATASYLNIDRFSVTNLPSNMKLVVESNYIVIRSNTFTVTVRAGSGGTVNSTSSVTINNVAAGTSITTNAYNKTLTIGGTVVRAEADVGYKFSGWSYSGTTVTSNMTITANFELVNETYTVTVLADNSYVGVANQKVIRNVKYGTKIRESGETIYVGDESVEMYDSGYDPDYLWVYESDTVTSDMTIVCVFSKISRSSEEDWYGDSYSNLDFCVLDNMMSRGRVVIGVDEGRELTQYEQFLVYVLDLICRSAGGDSADTYGALKYVLQNDALSSWRGEYTDYQQVVHKFVSVEDINDCLANGEFDFYFGKGYASNVAFEESCYGVYNDWFDSENESEYRDWMEHSSGINWTATKKFLGDDLMKDYLIIDFLNFYDSYNNLSDWVNTYMSDDMNVRIYTYGKMDKSDRYWQQLFTDCGYGDKIIVEEYGQKTEKFANDMAFLIQDDDWSDIYIIDLNLIADCSYLLHDLCSLLPDAGVPMCVLSDWSLANYETGVLSPFDSYFIYTDESRGYDGLHGQDMYMSEVVSFVKALAQYEFDRSKSKYNSVFDVLDQYGMRN